MEIWNLSSLLHGKQVRYRIECKKRNFISPSNHVLFCLFYKPINNKVFDNFLKISNHFWRDFLRFWKCCPIVIRMFLNIFRTFPSIVNFAKMFRLNIDKPCLIQHFKHGTLVSKCYKIDIFTCERYGISAHVKIWFFSVREILVIHSSLCTKFGSSMAKISLKKAFHKHVIIYCLQDISKGFNLMSFYYFFFL